MLWTPESIPPQLTKETEKTVLLQLLDEGLVPAVERGLSALQSECEPLGEYIDRFGFTLNRQSKEGIWPERILKIGASIAFMAYRENRYFQIVNDEALETGSLLAEMEGIPEAYLASVQLDANLADLTASIADAMPFFDTEGGYRQVLDIGAGCTRYFMQQAMAA